MANEKKDETTPVAEPGSQDTIEYTDTVPPELRDAEMVADAAAAEKAAPEPEAEEKPREELTVTAEEEEKPAEPVEAEKSAEEAAAAPAKEPTVAEQINSVREVYDERFKELKEGFATQLEQERARLEQQYAPILKATREQEQKRIRSEAEQKFVDALGADFEEKTGISPSAAQRIASAAMQHMLPADPFMRDARAAQEASVYRETWTKFDGNVASQVKTELGTTEVSQDSLKKGMDLYNQLVKDKPQMGLDDAAKEVADAIVAAERGNGKTTTAVVEPTPAPAPKADTTSAAPPRKAAVSEEEMALQDYANRVFEEERRERGFDSPEPL
jgi:hypothetical protein